MKIKHIQGLLEILDKIGVNWIPHAPKVEQDSTYGGSGIKLLVYGGDVTQLSWTYRGLNGVLTFSGAVERYVSAQDATQSRAILVSYNILSFQIMVRESALASVPSYPTLPIDEILISQFIVPPTGQPITPPVITNAKIEWEIYFPAIENAVELQHNVAMTITAAITGTKISTITYSVNDGVSYSTPVFPITVAAGTCTKWKVTAFTGIYIDGSLIIQATKS